MADKNPDYIYDPDNWEVTYDWGDRSEAAEGMDWCSVRRCATLLKGPDKFAAMVPEAVDDNGDPDGCTLEWFDAREDADAVIVNALAKLRAAVTPRK